MRLNKGKSYGPGGWIITEILVGLVVLGILLSVMTQLIIRSRTVSKRFQLKQQCITAIQAQLDSIQFGQGKLAEDEIKANWPKVDLKVKASPAEGKWIGFTLYEVTGRYKAGPNVRSVVLSRYVRGREGGK